MQPLFHISFNSKLEGVWQPKLPDTLESSQGKYKENLPPRVCLSPTIELCFKAIYPNVSRYFEELNYPHMEFYVYQANLKGNERVLTPVELTKKQLVHDAHITQEHVVLDKVSMSLVRKVKILNTNKSKDLNYHPFDDPRLPLKYLCPRDIVVKDMFMSKVSLESNQSKSWNPLFGPSYTPEEMLKLGVFEGKYINNIKGIPSAWKKLDKVLSPSDKPDESLNKYKVKSRQPLSVWRENGWIKPSDPNGWFEWYIHYYLGRRLPDEDTKQIGRWRSFVARHQGQIVASCSLNDESCHAKQRQGLLQWAWDSSTKFDAPQVAKNAKKLSKDAGVSVGDTPDKIEKVAKEYFPVW